MSLACADDASPGVDGDDTSTSTSDESETAGDGDGDFNFHDGDYLLTLSMEVVDPYQESADLDPELPVQFIVSVSMDEDFVSFSFQPLALDVGSITSPRTLIGDPWVYSNIPHVNGEFTLNPGDETGVVTIAGKSNPVDGSDLLLAIILDGSFQLSSFCGSSSWGFVTNVMESPSPSDFDPIFATFAAIKIDGTLPTELPLSCDDLN